MKSITLKINGVQHDVVVEEDMVLLDLLREELRLTGTKQGCDRKGQCGACTVIVNGKTVLSCLSKVVNLEGAEVITVEGLGTPDNPHLIQEAYVLSGAIQCGFCTPGLIMETKALLEKKPKPTRDEIKTAFRNHLCRCTGYGKIIEAVELAGRFLRGETTPDKVRPDPNDKKIGVSHPRPWSMLKACGLAPFAADIIMPDALQLAVVASPHHNARIKKIDFAAAAKMPGVVGIMTAKDITGNNILGKDKKVLFDVGDIAPLYGAHIAIVAANSRKQALAAAEAVKVEYEVLPRISNAKEALAPNAAEVQPGTGNICMLRRQIKGDAKKALDSSAFVVETDFSTPWIHQAPLEPEAGVAYMTGKDKDAELVVIGRSLRIHDHAKALKAALGWENLRYQEAFTGGQFGIKVDLTSEQIAGAAALHFQRPARYIPSTEESLRMTSKRHPFGMKVRLGADKQGRLTGYEIEAIIEKGAFSSAAAVIVLRALAMLSGAYNIPNVNAEVKMVFTNNIWGGAARGAGPPQVNYALESTMNLLAAKVGMDPLAFRQLNIINPDNGESTSSGHVMEEWAVKGCLEKAKPIYEKALKEAAAFKSANLKRGVGLAASSFGIGEPKDKADVAVELDADDGLTVFASVADPGEGNDSMLSQIASHLTNIPLNKIRLQTRDSALTPVSAISAGSRQTFLSGHALVKAIEELQAAMKEVGAKTHADLVKAGKPTRYQARHSFTHTGIDEEKGQGEFFISRCHGVQVAEVEVDTKSGEVRVLKMTGVVDAGTLINPLNVLCQIEGGMDMGAGMALREQYVHGETKDWVSYKYPTMKTSFDKDVILIETPRKNGPLGATGIGEFTLMPTSPSIMNAIENAIGVRIHDLPATPDKILKALKSKK